MDPHLAPDSDGSEDDIFSLPAIVVWHPDFGDHGRESIHSPDALHLCKLTRAKVLQVYFTGCMQCYSS